MGSTCDTTTGDPQSISRHPSCKDHFGGCRGGEFPFFTQFASVGSPLRPSAGSLTTNSPCCKRYRSPRREHTTTRLARSTRTNSPPPPPAPHKHLPPPDPSAARWITEHYKRVPANSLLSDSSRDPSLKLLFSRRHKRQRKVSGRTVQTGFVLQ